MADKPRSRKRRPAPPPRIKASGQGKKTAGPAGDLSLLKDKIPEAAIRRLSTYQRILNQLGEEGIPVASSAELAGRCGVNPAQVRKDLAYFGGFGIRGKGYYVKDLGVNLKKILGVTTIQKVALVGAGNLGSALLAHKEFLSHGFVIDAVFDKFPKSAQPRKGGGPSVMSMSKLGAVVRARKIEIGIVAVPGEGAQGVVTRLVEAGVRGILNFAPVQVSAPPGVKIKNVDLASELEHLSYHLSITEED